MSSVGYVMAYICVYLGLSRLVISKAKVVISSCSGHTLGHLSKNNSLTRQDSADELIDIMSDIFMPLGQLAFFKRMQQTELIMNQIATIHAICNGMAYRRQMF